MFKLTLISGKAPQNEYKLNEGENYIGRKEDCHIFLDSVRVSRKHARITVSDEKIQIDDLNSSNGTIVNGNKIHSSPLCENDKIFIGDFIFRLVSDDKEDLFPNERATKPDYLGDKGANLENVFQPPSFTQDMPSEGAIQQRIDASIKEQESHPTAVSPLVKIARHFNLLEWKYKIIIAIAIYVAVTYKFMHEQIIVSQSKGIVLGSREKAVALVKYLAEKSKDQLLANNDLLLDIDDVQKEKGVTEVYVADSYGRIRAPLSKINTELTDPVSQNALTEGRVSDNFPDEDGIIKYLKEGRTDIKFTVAYPIRVWDTNEGSFKQLGIAVIIFSPNEITSRVISIKELKMKGLLIAIVPGIILFFLIYFFTVSPIRRVKENISSLVDGGNGFKIPHSFIELANLIESIKILLAKTSFRDGQMDGKTEISEFSIGKENIDDLLGVVSDGIIVTNKNSRIEIVNEAAVSLLRLPISGGIGQHILEVLPDKEILSIVNSVLNNITKTKEKEASEEIEFGGPGKKLLVRARAMRERFGEISAIVISFKEEIA